jgi:hypothetical protein
MNTLSGPCTELKHVGSQCVVLFIDTAMKTSNPPLSSSRGVYSGPGFQGFASWLIGYLTLPPEDGENIFRQKILPNSPRLLGVVSFSSFNDKVGSPCLINLHSMETYLEVEV